MNQSERPNQHFALIQRDPRTPYHLQCKRLWEWRCTCGATGFALTREEAELRVTIHYEQQRKGRGDARWN